MSTSKSLVDMVAKCTSQMRAVWSDDAVTMRPPARAEGGGKNEALVPAQDLDLIPGVGIPDARSLVA
jgi:hypothetical protein